MLTTQELLLADHLLTTQLRELKKTELGAPPLVRHLDVPKKWGSLITSAIWYRRIVDQFETGYDKYLRNYRKAADFQFDRIASGLESDYNASEVLLKVGGEK